MHKDNTDAARAQDADRPLTDAGNAEVFADLWAHCVRFDHRRGRWLIYREHRWVPDGDGEATRLALDAMRHRQHTAIDSDEPDRHARRAWGELSESRQRLNSLLALAKTIRPIADSGEDWDRDPFLLGVANGVIDLRTGTLRAGRPEDRITMSARPAFDPDARCSLWTKTIAEVFTQQPLMIDYAQRALGYSLTGDCREECFFFTYGGGGNGKGTMMNTVAYVLGDYADDLPFSALELRDRSSIPNDIAKLVGRRFVTAAESGETSRLNEARLKALTGRDPMTARFLYGEHFTFTPAAKFWLAANHKPIVRDDSEGFWRRVHLIPFTASFTGRANKELKDALRSEASGILRWLVEGCLRWQAEGLDRPADVEAATTQYRQESEPLARFFEDRCILAEGESVSAGELFAAYVAWAARVGIKPLSQLNQKRFGQEIRKRFSVDERRHVRYVGIALRPAQDIEAESACSLKPADALPHQRPHAPISTH